MRLTLRTLLAYLDDILDPSDAQDLARRIEGSEFAANVVQKTRDVMSRMRLGAPQLSGRGMGVDPNTVSEYLDSTLPPERVPDFEKVCLESDVHLAEVACCHQILTLVLGEPAQVDVASRERMHGLLTLDLVGKGSAALEQPAVSPPPPAPVDGQAVTNGTAAAPDKAPARHRPEVPQELRDAAAPWSVWMVATVVLLMAVLGGIIAVSVQPQWLDALRGKQQVASATNGELPLAPTAKEGAGLAGAAVDESPSVADGDADATHEAETSSVEPGLRQPESVESPDRAPEADSVDEPADAPSPEDVSTEGVAEAPAEDMEVAVPAPPDPDGDDEGPPEAAGPDESSEACPPGTEADPLAAEGAPGTEEPVEVPRDGIGRNNSNGTVALRFDADGQQWRRLPAQDVLFPGDRLRSLPTYRSELLLSNGMTLTLIGETEITLNGPDAEGLLVLTLAYGRAALMTVGKAQARVRLQAGDQQGTLSFDDFGSALAIEVKPLRAEGADPETAPLQWQVALYVNSAKTLWEDAVDGEQLSLEAPARQVLGQPASEEVVEIPGWIATDQTNELDQKASKAVEEQLRQTDRSTVLGLQELAEHRRTEFRALAVRCLGSIDQFEPLVAALNDPGQKASWNDHVDSLRAGLDRGPATAALVRQAFTTLRGEEAPDLYRMIWGYSATAFQPEDAETLVARLDHDDLDVRVLSFWNLRGLTGFSLFYRPEYPETRRATYVQKWQQKLKSGQIVAKPAP